MNRKTLRRTCGTLAAALLALSPRLAVTEPGAVTEIMCPENGYPLLRVEHSYGVDRSPAFMCWYKVTDITPGVPSEVRQTLETKGRCGLKQADEIRDGMRQAGRGFTDGSQTCRGDRTRCVVTCRAE